MVELHYFALTMTAEPGMSVKHPLTDASLLNSLLQFDQHGRPVSFENVVGNDVVLRPWKRPKREIWGEVAKHAFPPDGKPPERLTNGQVTMMICNMARNLGIEANLRRDGSSMLRAVGRKPS
jgi:hypothetical protein